MVVVLGKGSVVSARRSGGEPWQTPDRLGRLWQDFSNAVDPLGHDVRTALHRLCVDDIWSFDGPAWLNRLINSQRAHQDWEVSGELARAGDRDTLRNAVQALIALAIDRGKAGRIVPDTPPAAEVPTVPEPDEPELPPIRVDPAFLDEKGHMRPWPEVAAIIRERNATG